MGFFDVFKKGRDKGPKTPERRKAETETLLRKLGIPTLDHLPLIEDDSQVQTQSAADIARRVLILCYLGYCAEMPDERGPVVSYLKQYDLWDSVSPEEQDQFQKPEMSEQEVINAIWRCEALWLLLWSIQRVPELALPREAIHPQEALRLLPGFLEDPVDFIKTAKLRPSSEILDMSDLMYRMHWAVRDAYLNGRPIPAGLNTSVVQERHYAINWVTCYADEWDEITTDT